MPSSAGVKPDRAPPKLPIAVRAPDKITMSDRRITGWSSELKEADYALWFTVIASAVRSRKMTRTTKAEGAIAIAIKVSA